MPSWRCGPYYSYCIECIGEDIGQLYNNHQAIRVMGLLGLLITGHTVVTLQASWNNSNKMGMGAQTKPWRNTCRRSVACVPAPLGLVYQKRSALRPLINGKTFITQVAMLIIRRDLEPVIESYSSLQWANILPMTWPM